MRLKASGASSPIHAVPFWLSPCLTVRRRTQFRLDRVHERPEIVEGRRQAAGVNADWRVSGRSPRSQPYSYRRLTEVVLADMMTVI
jgi:hypothetical protein